MRYLILVFIGLLAVSLPVWAASWGKEGLEDEYCTVSISIGIEGKSSLDKKSIQNLVSSRLRAARIGIAPMSGKYVSLAVDVGVLGAGNWDVFRSDLSLVRRVLIDSPMKSLGGVTWATHYYGIDQRNNVSMRLRDFISRSMDEFINEYLKANQDYCRK